MEKNSEHIVSFTGLNSEGQGVTKVDGCVVFVEGALPGEEALIKIIKVNRNYMVGKLMKITIPSVDRCLPFCKADKRCGGCTLQHMTYEAQLAHKTRVIYDALTGIGGYDGKEISKILKPIIGADNPRNYRNKSILPCGPDSQGGICMGFYAKRSHNIVEHASCDIQNTKTNEINQYAQKILNEFKISPYGKDRGKGLLRHFMVRAAVNTGEFMLIFVLTEKTLPHCKEITELLVGKFPEIASIYINVNKSNGNAILGNEFVHIFGKTNIIDRIGEMQYEISPGSFYQVNPEQTKKLYDKIRELANLSGDEKVLDIYCGAGTIGLYLAKKAGSFIGVESFPQAVTDARRNANINNVCNAEFICGKAEEVLHLIEKDSDLVIIDPPRKGCDRRFLEYIADIPRIIYVSCNPATLARDLSRMESHQPQIIQPVDMFPYTTAVETVVLLSRKTTDLEVRDAKDR